MSKYILSIFAWGAFLCLPLWLTADGLNGAYHLPDPFEAISTTPAQDTIPKDRKGNFVEDPSTNPFDLDDPAAIEQSIDYDPETGLYIITERIGEDYYRAPSYMTFEEYLQWSKEQEEQKYFQQLAGVSSGPRSKSGKIDPVSTIDISDDIIDRLFGGTEVDIRPQGNIDLTFGVDYQRQDNPILLERQRRTGGFDFDMDIQVNVNGKIGEKLNTSFNYNTQSTFDFENKLKLEYNSEDYGSGEDDIIQKIEAGDVSLPLRGSLIQGSQSLFGIKTEMKFGYLRLTMLASQQRSEKNDLTIQGGSVLQDFEVDADQYVENRHFFLSHFNRETFEGALGNLPQINSLFRITRIEVWVTNDKAQTTNVRDIVALADAGEGRRFTLDNPDNWKSPDTSELKDICNISLLPSNQTNTIIPSLQADPENRFAENAVRTLVEEPYNFREGKDFERIRARRLSPTEYTVNNELGFISLNTRIDRDWVVAVAYEFTYNGVAYQVGELSDVVPVDPDNQSVLYTKLLKGVNQRVDLPMWDLMMKNFYFVGGGDLNPEEFELDVFYEDPGQGFKRFLPAETGLGDYPLITAFNLDNLNATGDPQPDGRFDFVPGFTIYPQQGKIMFPVLEPFGSSLENLICTQGTCSTAGNFTYHQLYDSTKFRAQEFPELNRFTIKGESKSSTSSDISLGAFNIPPGSVRVTAGGQLLVENEDYIVDYNIGRLQIINQSYLQPGTPIRVSFEDNALFSFQKKTMLGVRADYEVSKNLNIGATYMHMFERPYTQKVNIGDDPINNRIYGLDVNYSNEAPWLTRLVDAIPGIDTKAPSQINFQAEFAAIKPGHSKAINSGRKDKEGVVYIDDFEGTASNIDLRVPVNNWHISSVPKGAILNGVPAFPESELFDTTLSGVNRAHINWYRVDRSIRNSADNQNPYTRAVNQQEIFTNRTPRFGPNDFRTFDITYYPDQRGQYNFDPPLGSPYSFGLDDSCRLEQPQTRWGGIMRALRTTDFEQANIEAIEFWLLNPFINGAGPTDPDAKLVINLGEVSEDILQDSRLFYEHGLPRGPDDAPTDTTGWGRIPKIQPVVNAFSINEDERVLQDVGLDGWNDAEEREFYDYYLEALRSAGVSTECLREIENDPANDNFCYFRDPKFDQNAGVLNRYTRFNGTQGNSPTTGFQDNNISANTNIPDSEDFNVDNSLSSNESYYQYELPLIREFGTDRMQLDARFVTDTVNGTTGTWYRYRIPLDHPSARRIGDIQGFRSIRFMRMYLTGFDRQATLRFATLDLVRNQWRRFKRAICGEDAITEFAVDAVNIEENADKIPFPYVVPEGIQRERIVGSTYQDIFQNEQSLALRFEDLVDSCEVRVFKTLNLDMRVFKRLQMFAHAEELIDTEIPDKELQLFLRLGSDFDNNYYEVEIPLIQSRNTMLTGDSLNQEIWREENNLDIAFEEWTDLKVARNASGSPLSEPYSEFLTEGPDDPCPRRITVRGNPTLGYVRNVMIGLRNPNGGKAIMSGEVWVNELRAVGLDERGGVAALARLDMDLADFGSVGVSTNYSSIGYGAIDQKLDERAKESLFQFDASANLELGKFFGQEAGISIPFYAQYSTTTSTPRFDPIDLDLDLKEKLNRIDNQQERDSVKNQAIDRTTLKTISVTNVRKQKKSGGKPMPWDISNFSVSYAFSKSEAQNEVVEKDDLKQHRASLDYSFSLPALYIQPLKNVSKSKWLKPLTEMNLNPIPNSFSFNTLMDRRFGERSYRFSDPLFKTWFDKRFTWDRNYNVKWDLTKSIKINYNAAVNSVVDEPEEYLERPPSLDRIDVKERRDSIWSNIRKFGRPKLYSHNARATYNLPFKHFPMLDWIRSDISYDANYSWTAAAQNADSLGNVIQNGQNRQLSIDLDFVKLYNKSGFLKKVNGKSGSSSSSRRNQKTQSSQKQQDKPDDKQQKSDKKDGKEKKEKTGEPPGIVKAIVRPLLAVRKLRFNYTRNFSTVVPGYVPTAGLFGLDNFNSPGWDFVFGLQPEITKVQNEDEQNNPFNDWLNDLRTDGEIVQTSFQNQQVIQTESESVDGRLTIEPFADFKIDVDARRDFTTNFSLFYKNTVKGTTNPDFRRLSPREVGSFSMSYLSLQTLFDDSETQVNELFKAFEAARVIVSNDRGVGMHELEDSYAEGFGSKQQDIIIPAFLQTYTNKDIRNKDVTDLFDEIPRPNWRLSYNGLHKIPLFSEIFSSVRITHSYKSTLSINSFQTDLNYSAYDGINFIGQQNSNNFNNTTRNYYSRYIIPAVSVDEQFSPLVGVEIKTKNDMNISFNYNKRRGLQLGFVSSELAENRQTSIDLGFDFLLKDVDIGFLQGGRKRKTKKDDKAEEEDSQQPPAPAGRGGRGRGSNQAKDLEILFDFSLSDNLTVNHYLDQQSLPQPTRGSKEISISPAVRYTLNKNVNLRMFFDYRKTTPYTTTGYPITTASGGVTVQISLE